MNTSTHLNKTKVISFILGTALIFSVISSDQNKKVKIALTEIVTVLWFIYAFYHKDYLVLFITILLLFFAMSGNL
jgi:hypothetical protein